MTLTIGSLFSGIGGLELGLERAGLGPVVWQCEIDQFCRRVLARHWPDSGMLCDDIKTIKHPPPVDLICGGFPCQDVSSAGKGAGLAGSRSGLWFEFARIVGLVRPSWVVVENVASGANRWVYDVCAGLAKLGYETLPVPVSAQDVGAPHLRRRVFVIGHTDRDGQSAQPLNEKVAGVQSDPGFAADTDSPELWQQPGRGGRQDGEGQVLAGLAGLAGQDGKAGDSHRPPAIPLSSKSSPWEAVGEPGWRPPFSPIRGVDDGVSNRVDRLKALGNAVVPQCAEVIGHMINELEARQ